MTQSVARELGVERKAEDVMLLAFIGETIIDSVALHVKFFPAASAAFSGLPRAQKTITLFSLCGLNSVSKPAREGPVSLATFHNR